MNPHFRGTQDTLNDDFDPNMPELEPVEDSGDDLDGVCNAIVTRADGNSDRVRFMFISYPPYAV